MAAAGVEWRGGGGGGGRPSGPFFFFFFLSLPHGHIAFRVEEEGERGDGQLERREEKRRKAKLSLFLFASGVFEGVATTLHLGCVEKRRPSDHAAWAPGSFRLLPYPGAKASPSLSLSVAHPRDLRPSTL